MESDDRTEYGSIAVAKAVGISLRQLYYWVEALDAVQPQIRQYGTRSFRRFSSRDLQQLKMVQHLIGQGYTHRAAVHMVKGQRP